MLKSQINILFCSVQFVCFTEQKRLEQVRNVSCVYTFKPKQKSSVSETSDRFEILIIRTAFIFKK